MTRWSLFALAATLLVGACSAPDAREPAPAPATYAAAGWTAMDLPELAEALATGEVTSVVLTQAYLDRIERIDRTGPRLQAVLAVNPDALAQAAASDARRAAGDARGPLDGMPLLLKDNIETLDPVATTAGSLALKDNFAGRDSPVAASLRAEGAVILGKTNLSEWANFRDDNSVSGWSAIGGQTRNPHMLDRSPCGSSSGSGAAIAASLAAGAVGTETNGSIICPANVNGIVGFKPTVGLIPGEGIVPISPSQDTAGPMTKTVRAAAIMLNAMAPGEKDFTTGLSPDALRGVRVGVLRFAEGKSPAIRARFDDALAVMAAQGATLVEIDAFAPAAADFWTASLVVLQYEFKDSLNAYLATTPQTVTTRTLADVIAFNAATPDELAIFGQSLFGASEARGPLSDAAYLAARDAVRTSTRTEGIDRLLAENGVSLLVAPSGPVAPRVDHVNGDVWPEWAGAGWLAAIAGYPNLSVPMGEVHAIPVGVSFMGGSGADARVLAAGFAYEQASRKRIDPAYLRSADERPEIAAAVNR